MPLPSPLAMLVDTAQAMARVPLRMAEAVVGKAVGTVAGATAKRATPAPAQRTSPTPGTPHPDLDPVEEIARAAVAREMAEQPLGTPTEPAPKPRPTPRRAPEPDDTRPLIDSGTANAVRSEAETMQAAADVDKRS